jgi:hypothetical protein
MPGILIHILPESLSTSPRNPYPHAPEYAGVDLLRDLLDQEKSAVAIDLKDVLLVDREAVKLLARSESNAVELRNCPVYIREWIKRERTDANAS